MYFTAQVIILLCLFGAFIHVRRRRRRQSLNLPPGPYPFPIIGNFLQLGRNPHQSLATLSKSYGPLMLLKLGNLHTVVVSSPDIAKEILQKHDHSFPARPTASAARALDHHVASLACLPVGTKWRNLRRICREQMFSTQQLDAGRRLRHEKLQKLVEYGRVCCWEGRALDIGEAAFTTSLNLISNTLFSVDFADYGTDSSQELKRTIRGLMRLLGSFNLADYFKILGWFDPQGIKGEAEIYMKKLLEIFDGIIDQRKNSDQKRTDFLEALLQISEGNGKSELSREDITHLLLDLFVAGTDTSSGTVEWVMTELLRHPNVMSKTKLELQAIVGHDKQVEESDIPKLPYLQAVIKESFRYHPPGPFLARQMSEDDRLEIWNYVIPKNAVILVNIWAMGRDPSVWPNPNSFEPERFLDAGTVDVKGQHFELIPFGAGRRICPGMPLAYRMVHLMVATLVHNFDWELEDGMGSEEVDISEKFGVSLQKAVALKAKPLLV